MLTKNLKNPLSKSDNEKDMNCIFTIPELESSPQWLTRCSKITLQTVKHHIQGKDDIERHF